jgi:general transcription factor 3C polypeptide 1
MDALVSAALEEVCARLSVGLPVADLWPALSGAFQVAGLPPDLPVKRVLFARLMALPVINLVEGEPPRLVQLPDKDVEVAERRGALLLATPDLRDNFLGLYDHRHSSSRLSDTQRKTLEYIGEARFSLSLSLSYLLSLFASQISFSPTLAHWLTLAHLKSVS